VVYLAKHLGGSIILGIVVGVGLALFAGRVKSRLPVLVIAASFGIALFAKELKLEPLIVGLTSGLMMRNLWKDATSSLFESMEQVSLPVYAVFFAVAGCKVDPQILAQLWQIVGALVLVRAGAVWVGTRYGAKLAGMDPPFVRWGWTAFVSQAGVSLALAYVIQRQFGDREFGIELFNVLLSAIALHELIGPLLFKLGLTRAGVGATKPAPPEGESSDASPQSSDGPPAEAPSDGRVSP
jgi:Kef-type K+ transport system membrane component KefB